MPALSAYSNTENTALVILQEKGYQTWYDKDAESYCAEKNGWDFQAASATELLGVVAIFEFQKPNEFKEYWWKISDPDILMGQPCSPTPYSPIWSKK